MKKTYLLKAVAFTLIIGILLTYVSDILILKKVTPDDTANTYIQKGIYELEENSVELCFLGNSQMVYGVSGMYLLENYGISSYSASTSLQPFFLNLYNLKELQKTQDIKTVVLDMGSIDRNTTDERNRMVLDNAPMSFNKLKAIWEYSQTSDANEIWTYIFPIMKYHGRWSELSEEDFNYKDTNTHVFKGNILSSDIVPIERERIISDDGEGINPNSKLNGYQVKYFRQIVEYCQENDINLVLIKTPKLDWDKAKMLAVQELADEYGLEYLDFNTEALMQATGISTDTDFKDIDHLNTYGAEKLTSYLAEYLLEHYEFTDYRESADYTEESLEAYHIERNKNFLRLASTPEEALKAMAADEDYEIFLQSSSDISSYWTEELQTYMSALGLKQNIAQLTGTNFVAYLSNGESIYEQGDDAFDIAYKGELAGERGSYKLTSNLIDTVSEVSITVDGQKEVFSNRGLNIVVYHKGYEEVVRSFTLYVDPTTNTLTIQ